MSYAKNTSVSAERSREEIERTLARYGADLFMYAWEAGGAMIAFRMAGRNIRFLLPVPDRKDPRFTHHARGKRTAEAAERHWEQATRQRWRALLLIVKAKLEAVESGISTVEAEFLANTMLPDGTTVGEFMAPQIERAYDQGEMPSGLLELTSGS